MFQYKSLNTPGYLYDLHQLDQTIEKALYHASQYNYEIHYAIKANNNEVINRRISNYRLGADCVSGNEILEALRCGFDPGSVVYAGVGKSDEEIEIALEKQISCLNCESFEELQVIEEIAKKMNKKAPVAIRINPGVKAHTHQYITTGLVENKFGIHLDNFQEALDFTDRSNHLHFKGLHFHIGSQITQMEPFKKLCDKVNQIWQNFDIDSYNPELVNLGGGLGVNYDDPQTHAIPDFKNFFDTIANTLDIPEGIKVHFELGRSLVAQCGKILTKVLYTKKGVNKDFVITDAGMTELMRPSLYQAKHKIKNMSSPYNEEKIYDVVGPVCESSDVFDTNVSLSETRRGEILAIESSGAYAESMSLNYNMRKKPVVYFLEGNTLTTKPDYVPEDHLKKVEL